MRDRINCLIYSAADQPYALEIRYHCKCCVRKYQKSTHHYCHQCHHHPSWDDSQQRACRLLLQAGHGDQLLERSDVWTMHDLKRCSACPDEIFEGEPSISIIDNDDFLNDTLTGAGTAHRCNWMFLPHLEHLSIGVQEYQENIEDEDARIKRLCHSAPYNQPFLHPMFLLWTSTQLMLLERRS